MRRLWRMVYEHVSVGPVSGDVSNALTDDQRNVRRAAHSTLQKVTDDLGRRRVFNTAIAAVMEFMNTLSKFDDASAQGRVVRQEALELVVQMLSPIVPHAAHSLWKSLGHDDALIDHPWPKPDTAALVRDSIDVVVQVNGKLRSQVTVEPSATEDEIRAAALADPAVQKWMDGKAARKVIVVKGKLVNVVV